MFPNPSAADGAGVEGLCCAVGFQPCAGCVAASQPETLHTVSNPVNHKISRE